jgi:trafficking protein particle complex subunit 10
LSAAKDTILNKNNGLDLTLNTGWNDLADCEVSVKPATGGLRLLTTEAVVVEESSNGAEFAKPPGSGVFFFGTLEPQQALTVRLPFSLEQDLPLVSLKVEVTYKTNAGDTYYLAKFVSAPVALAVGVNVQDIFKHNALFSRFSVSSASSSPLRIFETELFEAELFESSSNTSPSGSLLVFAKQSANFLYKIKRKPGVDKSTKRVSKVMRLKLHFSQLHAEIEELFSVAVTKLLRQSPSLAPFARTVRAIVVDHVRNGLDALDLERAALLGVVATAFLSKIQWAVNLKGLAVLPDTGEDAGAAIAALMNDWQTNNPRVSIPTTPIIGQSSIIIPVEIPSIPVVHTADIRLDPSVTSPFSANQSNESTPIISVNQVLQATLHLKWTRLWDTTPPRKDDDYQEFSYEVTAPPENWILGGRRKGHFVIPRSSLNNIKDEDTWLPISSTPETEASIPLMLIPQREGWLPYPSVDIRVVPVDGEPQQQQTHPQGLEIDWKNSGETVRVVGGRASVTVSLDASGPGGGPLLLSVDRVIGEGARIIT